MVFIDRKFLESSATLISCTVGAGILGIPYVIEKSGFIIGIFELFLIALIFFIIDSMLFKISMDTKGKAQLATYAEKYLGKRGKLFTSLILIFSITGAMTAYLIAIGGFLSQIFFQTSKFHFLFALLFFLTMSVMIYLGLDIVEKSEFYIMFLFIAIVLILSLISIPRVNAANLLQIHIKNFLVPYGVLLFAFISLPAIPEAREELKGEESKFLKVILLGLGIPLILYILFTMTIIGISGKSVTQSAILNLTTAGRTAEVLGLIFGTLTISSTFLALGLALKDMYRYDFKQNRLKSTILAVTPPLIIFLWGFQNFTEVLSITGSVSGLLLISLVVAMFNEYSKKKHSKDWMNNLLLKIGIILFLIIGSIYQIVSILS